MAEEQSLEFTPTWIVAVVCLVIVFISLCVERLIHRLGKLLKHKKQDALFEALQKLKEELMLLGFISLLLTVLQGTLSQFCIAKDLTNHMLPCKKKENESFSGQGEHNTVAFPSVIWNGRRLLASGGSPNHCAAKGKAQFLSLEGLHQLHIFVFVLAVVHVVFCASTMVLAGAKIQEWKHWENSIRHANTEPGDHKRRPPVNPGHAHHHLEFFRKRAEGYWRKNVIVGWIRSFFKQFYGSVTKSDYVAMRLGFIATHCPSNPDFDFHRYMMRTLEIDFKKVVGISWYLWLFLVFFLLLNVQGWHTYFWLAFVPLGLLLLVGSKLEHIITKLAEEISETRAGDSRTVTVKPSDKHFWFGKPGIVLYLIHFILFQNAFEIAFFFWIWSTYGFNSCIMEKLGFVIPRLIIGVLIQVLCSYSTLPLYAIVTQMGSMFKKGIFDEQVQSIVQRWHEDNQRGLRSGTNRWKLFESTSSRGLEMQKMAIEAFGQSHTAQWRPPVFEGITITECSDSD